MEFVRFVGAVCFFTALLMGLHWIALMARADLVVMRLRVRRSRAGFCFSIFLLIFVLVASSVLCASFAIGKDGQWRAEYYVAIGGFLLVGMIFHLGSLWFSIGASSGKSSGALLYRYWLDGDLDEKWALALHTSCLYANSYQVWIAAAASMFVSLNMRAEVGVDPQYSAVEIAGSMAAAVSFAWVAYRLTLVGRLGRRLTTACFADWFDTRSGEESKLKISRWRNSEHRQMFQIASAIERCLPQLRQRLSSGDYQYVVASYMGLATMLRECVLRAGNPALRMDVLRWAAAALVLNDDPVVAARRLRKFVSVDMDADLPARGRLARVIAVVNQAIESAMKPVGVLAAISIVGYYIASGQIDILLKFVRSLLGAP